MAGYIDLTPYVYDKANESGAAVNVGWLSASVPFQTGDAPAELIERLREMRVTNLYRGWHNCDLCAGDGFSNGRLDLGRNGNGDLRVRGSSGVVYVAPVLILHYIDAHHYLPPQEFIDAVLARHHAEDK